MQETMWYRHKKGKIKTFELPRPGSFAVLFGAGS